MAVSGVAGELARRGCREMSWMRLADVSQESGWDLRGLKVRIQSLELGGKVPLWEVMYELMTLLLLKLKSALVFRKR